MAYKVHDSAIFCLEESNRFNGFFSGDKNGEIKFNTFTFNGEIQDRATANNKNCEGVRGLSASNSGLKLASVHEDKNLRIWDLANFTEE